ncbi:MAG TPA: hypothetical protein VK164_03245 [Flavobacterium sp.]|uniref:hypothetical protein n=1 Tax=Flavobacterium sp. TaxID=239 RepID=UPI002B4B2513|nr:hypothetical protein [Flavobacterium sp.]HLO72927.1 hypothetical protein [Flavobacterium sp.]
MSEEVTSPVINNPIQPEKNDKTSKLILSLLFDGIGLLSYLVPVFGEAIDILWAPISGLLLVLMFKGTAGKLAGIFGFIEEMIPFVDVIPTFTITWFYTYVIKGGKGQE